MKGYCGNVQATSATFDSDGFLHTGDVGYYDEDGFIYIVDRVKELIKYKGFQVKDSIIFSPKNNNGNIFTAHLKTNLMYVIILVNLTSFHS